MAKALWQITDYLKEKEVPTEYDKDSRTLFTAHDTPQGEIQSRFYYDSEMEVLSCQCIFTEILPKAKYKELCELANRFNEELGFGAFVILDQEDLVFEINYLIEENTPLTTTLVEKLTMIPAEAMSEHLAGFLLVAKDNMTAEQAFEEFWK
ncbi:MAG: YbjN domain-containing protein [Bacteroidales bacterium]